MKILIGLCAAALILLLSGCSQEKACAQVITPAVSPDGTCKEFTTPCEVPVGYTLVDKCGQNGSGPVVVPDLCAGVACGDKCIGTTFYSNGTCSLGVCTYAQQNPYNQSCMSPSQRRFVFDANLLFCDYDAIVHKYTLFYQIRNTTENVPTYRATIWVKVPSINYGSYKTIQSNYAKGRILWEEQDYSFLGTRYRGQAWEIRGQNTFGPLEFQLIYCEPEFSTKEQCVPETGIVVATGSTAELCSAPVGAN